MLFVWKCDASNFKKNIRGYTFPNGWQTDKNIDTSNKNWLGKKSIN